MPTSKRCIAIIVFAIFFILSTVAIVIWRIANSGPRNEQQRIKFTQPGIELVIDKGYTENRIVIWWRNASMIGKIFISR